MGGSMGLFHPRDNSMLQYGKTYQNSVEVLDLNDENPKWDSNLPSMGENRCQFASALLNGKLL